MYWRQKAQLLCTNQARTDQLQTIVTNRLAGMSMRTPLRLEQSSNSTARPSLIIVAEYNVKADADSVWADVTTANVNGWIVTPSFAAYAEMTDANVLNTLLDRVDW